MMKLQIHQGNVCHLLHPPDPFANDDGLEVRSNSALLIDEVGCIIGVEDASGVAKRYPEAEVFDHGDRWILPGFIDCHVHFPQLNIIGSPGKDLLQWLERYTYPAEARFDDPEYASVHAARFVESLFANGTTCAAVYGSSHEASATALFEEFDRRQAKAIVGKVSMDRNGPAEVLQESRRDREANMRLIDKWHGRDGRLFVALTPRFAPACSPELLAVLRDILNENPTVYVQTHYAETKEEVALVKRLFRDAPDYLGAYETFGLLGDRTILGHCVYPSDSELSRIKETGAKVAHCPASNLFLGSGLLPLVRLHQKEIPVGLATDVGAGTSLSQLRMMAAAYETQQLQGESVTAAWLLYIATLGGARVLSLDDRLGNFEVGKAADFVVIDPYRHPLLADRFRRGGEHSELLFALMIMGDDRVVVSTFIDGQPVYAAAD